MIDLPLAINFTALSDSGFWLGVLTTAGIYMIVALGLQLNVGYTGLSNFGAAGFMAIGAYTMAILTLKTDISFWISLPAAIVVAMLFGVLVGLPALRLRADYLAIATLAMAEVVRLIAVNWTGVTQGNLGLSCNLEGTKCFDDEWLSLSDTILGWLGDIGLSDPDPLLPLLLVVAVFVVVIALALTFVTKSPWGRVLRSVREDEDAARALGKNAFAYKLQSLAISGAIAAIAGWFLAFNLASVAPTSFEPLVTFFAYAVLVLGGLASYWGIVAGSVILWTLLEMTRNLDLPINADEQAAVRFMIVGLVLILLMAFRPQGLFGKKEEMVLGD